VKVAWYRTLLVGASNSRESAVAPGEGPPLHVHVDDNEVIYFLDGRFRLRIDDTVRDTPAGSFAFIPKGVPHAWQNVSDAAGRLLVMFMPAAPDMERFFEGLSTAAGDDSAAVAAAFARLADAAGMKVVGPPLAQSDPV
jgi:quercetin dioxygenase-like cupin family protein